MAVRIVEVRRDRGVRNVYSVYINGHRLDISPRTKSQADRIAEDLRGERSCEHEWAKIGTGFYACRLCQMKKFEHDSIWKPR